MAEASPGTRTVRIRLIAEALPPKEYQGRPTAFGLNDKKRQLHPGVEQPDGTVWFDLEVQVRTMGPTATLRFQGPFVLGKPDEQYIGLIWNYAGERTTIRGQKLRLDAIPEKLIPQATGRSPGILQARVLPITERTATIPVEWPLLHRWSRADAILFMHPAAAPCAARCGCPSGGRPGPPGRSGRPGPPGPSAREPPSPQARYPRSRPR
jgi:Family of unknown function (DUF5990)